MILNYKDFKPQIDPSSFVAENATVIGETTIGKDCTILFGVVIRGDSGAIVIGDETNIQDNAVVHVGPDKGCTIGKHVSVGHNAVVHGCTVEDNCLIGMNATLLNDCVIGEGSIIAAGALVKERQVIPPRSLVVGVPGKVIRTLDEEQYAYAVNNATKYMAIGKNYKEMQG